VMLACVPAGLVIEQGFVNREAVAWAATLALTALPWVLPDSSHRAVDGAPTRASPSVGRSDLQVAKEADR